jgi:transposase
MALIPTTQVESYTIEDVLFISFELSDAKWLARCSKGGVKTIERSLRPGDLGGLEHLVEYARRKLGLGEDARVVSCCEAGRDGFWPHRFLVGAGIENIVVDAASMKVSRRGRRPKNDRIDGRKLLADLIRHHRGDDDVWRVVRIPTPQDEDDRQVHRELEELKKERTQERNRIRSQLATQGIRVDGDLMKYLGAPGAWRTWNGEPLAKQLSDRLERQRTRLELVEAQIRELEQLQRESVKNPTTPKLAKIAKLERLRGIGVDSAWLLVMESLGWRDFRNRREVGGSVGLGGTPYDSGDSDREQGISKTGSARVRARLIELSWLWLRYQPNSSITRWFLSRYASQGKRAKRVGAVAVARRLMIQLWHFVEHDVCPPGAIIAKA